MVPGEILDEARVDWLMEQRSFWPEQIPDFVRVIPMDSYDLNFAYGFEWREEQFDIINGDVASFTTGPYFTQGFGIGSNGFAGFTPDIAGSWDQSNYAFYIDLISDLVEGKICVKSEISQERERTAKALEFAAAGNEVALVCSGDAGICALASLAFEIIEFESQGRWGQVSIEVIPGVSALQGAASRIGAPLGHDFCSISLSDLLTSWETIEK